jgi:DNA-directed RNA polymerase subunit alpha
MPCLQPRPARPLRAWKTTRVGQRTNYDKLIIDVWTDGTVTPEMALVEAAKILRKHLNPFVQYFDIGEEKVSEEASAAASVDEELIRKLKMPVTDLDSPSGRTTAWNRRRSAP